MKDKTKNLPLVLAILLFAGLSLWWVALMLLSEAEDFSRYVFGATYGLMALFGGLYGLATAKNWGGYTSALGRSILFLAIGLLLAEFGQLVFSYYNIVKEELIPYPSIADVGFFGSVPLYILGALSLAGVLNVSNSVKKSPMKLIIGVLVPLVLLISSYLFFLKGYDATEVSKLTMFLDFGYPLGQAIYMSIALVTLLAAARNLGGIMRKPLFVLLFAFFMQFVAEFNFLFQNSRGTWVNGGYGDYLYLIAYFVMTVSLIRLNSVFRGRTPSSEPAVSAQPQPAVEETL